MSDNQLQYWESPDGKLEIDPVQDGRPRGVYKGWNLHQASGRKEIEDLSLRLSKQRHEEHQRLKTVNFLRRIEQTKQRAASIRLGIHQAISPADAEIKRRTARFYDGLQDRMLGTIFAEFCPDKRTSALEMELTENGSR